MTMFVVAGVIALCAVAEALDVQARQGLRLQRSVHTRLHMASETFGDPAENFEKARKVLNRVVKTVQYTSEDIVRVKYAASMATRFSFFLGQGVGISLLGIDKNAKEKQNSIEPAAVIGALTDAILSKSDVEVADVGIKSVEAQRVLDSNEQRALFNKNFQAIADLLKTDLKNIEDQKYNFPHDLDLNLNNIDCCVKSVKGEGGSGGKSKNKRPSLLSLRQWSPLAVAQQVQIYIKDRKTVFDRRDRQDGFEMTRDYVSNKYPEYYLQNFHYQTDGWLSAKSARLYDYQVESLFLGTADAMRRQVLPFFTEYIRSLYDQGQQPKVLDVATGTGRFASFLMDNFPALKLDVLDLSPFYLAEARKVLRRYEGVTYVEAAAEEVPAADGTYDAITCVYLFHELPADVRKQVLTEWFRVLKPGGKVFFVDSAQQGEVPYDRLLDGFTIIAHEPYYKDYTQTDLGSLFRDAGFEVKASETEVHWVSKLMVAMKPHATPQSIETDTQTTETDTVIETQTVAEVMAEVVAVVVAEVVAEVKEGGGQEEEEEEREVAGAGDVTDAVTLDSSPPSLVIEVGEGEGEEEGEEEDTNGNENENENSGGEKRGNGKKSKRRRK